MNHLFIFDKNENLLDLLNSECYYDDDYKRQLNGEWSFTFYVKSDYLKYLEKPNKIGLYDREGKFQLFKIQECEDVFGNEESFEIYCVHDSYSLGQLIIEDKRVIGGTARDAIAKCLENSNYSIGNIADLGEETLSFYFISRLQGLYNIVETYGGELDFRFELNENKTCIVNRYVDLKYRLGEDTGLRFTFDLNLKGVTRNRSSEGHFTVLYGRGKSLEVGEGYSRRLTFDEVAWNTPTNPLNKPLGDKFLIDPEAVARWGRIEGIYENDAIEDAEELLKATHRALDEAKEPKISYSATIEDLSNLSGYEHLKFVLGDSIIIQDEKYKLNNEARIVSEAYSIKNKKQPKQVTLGYIQKGISDSLSGGSITNPTITAPTDIEIDDSDFPNTLPSTPILKAKGLFSSIMLEWTFESKTYYNYEIYASKIQNFNPDSSNLIFKGKASSLLHEVKPSETWYYRARAINTHGEVTDMSHEVSATAFKISDATEYFEDVAIKEALIDTLSLDRGWFGQLKGQFMDVKNLVVTDGNNIRTMYVDDFGRVHMNVSELKINSKDVLNQEQTETLIEAKAGEISLSVAKTEVNKTLKNYPTTTEMNSAILQKANEITSTVEETKRVGVELLPQSNKVNSINGYIAHQGKLNVGNGTLGGFFYTTEKSWWKSDFILVDVTKPISYYFKLQNTGGYSTYTRIAFEQYDLNKEQFDSNNTPYYIHSSTKTGVFEVDGFLAENTLRSDTVYIRLRILANWNGETMAQFRAYDLSIKQLRNINSTTQIAQLSDQIALKVEADGVKSIIQQNPESVKIGFNSISDYFDLNSTRLKVGHKDGSYTEMGQNGVKYYDAYASWTYHSLMKQGWLGDISGTSWSRTITLPPSFKGKIFSVIISVEQVNAVNTHDVIKHYKVTVPQDTVDYANGKFVINMSALAYYVPGQASATAITTNVSWIAIC
ncbi:prophage endopeptidase tail family protein [Turicibacter sanguinis]|uniref:prophage endopeptidase tail family protein n=1 Tax=Turicibacter sanguinis TaxID=154288 RepID=UPI0029426448|nr:prophage endopeptidase tail family protein [Turicibacter sanguinis]